MTTAGRMGTKHQPAGTSLEVSLSSEVTSNQLRLVRMTEAEEVTHEEQSLIRTNFSADLRRGFFRCILHSCWESVCTFPGLSSAVAYWEC